VGSPCMHTYTYTYTHRGTRARISSRQGDGVAWAPLDNRSNRLLDFLVATPAIQEGPLQGPLWCVYTLLSTCASSLSYQVYRTGYTTRHDLYRERERIIFTTHLKPLQPRTAITDDLHDLYKLNLCVILCVLPLRTSSTGRLSYMCIHMLQHTYVHTCTHTYMQAKFMRRG
jgi:hypothetical protein